mmetsp:Transcript_28411/g.75191  ORF Transcript_28411/g.75191 Transcript_28411/m.75191 type:complete len:209 (+) Transcript_28411:425-1051(+)
MGHQLPLPHGRLHQCRPHHVRHRRVCGLLLRQLRRLRPDGRRCPEPPGGQEEEALAHVSPWLDRPGRHVCPGRQRAARGEPVPGRHLGALHARPHHRHHLPEDPLRLAENGHPLGGVGQAQLPPDCVQHGRPALRVGLVHALHRHQWCAPDGRRLGNQHLPQSRPALHPALPERAHAAVLPRRLRHGSRGAVPRLLPRRGRQVAGRER